MVRCSSPSCKKYYVLQYGDDSQGGFSPIELTYNPPLDLDIPENIKNLSKEFCEIYEQSASAENQNFHKIAGVGYRKAAEFLYKDFAIKHNPDDEESIKKMMLKQVISKYMKEYPKIQNLSLTVAYLGNDETHYEKRHSDKDLNDLKRFLISSIKMIDADLDVDESAAFNA